MTDTKSLPEVQARFRGPQPFVEGLDEEGMREMWLAGISAAEIGRMLGCSRNTVIGRARRKGWDREPPVTTPRPQTPVTTLFQRMDRLHAALDAVLAETAGIGRIPDSAVIALPRSRRMAG